MEVKNRVAMYSNTCMGDLGQRTWRAACVKGFQMPQYRRNMKMEEDFNTEVEGSLCGDLTDLVIL